jgi:peptide-methionine (S)-S-oxide reductase
MKKIGFGGGCHWCTEAVLQALNGVELVEQGWIASVVPFDAFSEGVIVYFNDNINLETLIEVHLLTHSSANTHSMRKKYRSAVYYFDAGDKDTVETIIKQLALKNATNYITQTLPFTGFKINEESYLNYYKKMRKNPSARHIYTRN